MLDHLNAALTRVKLTETDDSGPEQKTVANGVAGQTFGGKKQKVVRVQPHGFTSHAPKGSVGMSLSLDGENDLALLLGLEHPDHRPRNLAEGETALYDQHGNILLFKNKQGVTWTVKDGAIVITAPALTIKADKIVLDGVCHVGGEGGQPASMKGTIDTGGNADDTNLATRVFVK